MYVTIFGGCGATGAYFSLKLFLVCNVHKLTIIGPEDSNNLEIVRKVGLTIQTSAGNFHINPQNFAYVGPFNKDILDRKQDLIIVALKEPDFDIEVAKQILHLTDSNSFIGFVSNGLPFYFLQGLNLPEKNHIDSVDPNGEINELLKSRKIISLLPSLGSHKDDNIPAKVIITTDQAKIKLTMGPLIKEYDVAPIADAFSSAGIPTILNQDNMHRAILQKLQFALSINVMSALLGRSNGDVFNAPETQDYIRYVINFVDDLSHKLGVGPLPNFDQFKEMNISILHYSSMHHDITHGKKPEIDVIVSTVIEIADYFEDKMLISTKPIELIKKLLIKKSAGELIEVEDIDNLYREASLALNFIDIETEKLLFDFFFKVVESEKTNPTIYVICGGPGSGKSTFANHALNLGLIPKSALHHEPDLVMLQLPGYQKDVEVYGLNQGRNNWNDQALQLANKMLNKAIKERSDIIYERTCGMQESYDFLKKMSNEERYSIILYGLFTPLEIALDRTHDREQKIGRHIPDEIVIERTKYFTTLWDDYVLLANQVKLYVSLDNKFIEIQNGDPYYQQFKSLVVQSDSCLPQNPSGSITELGSCSDGES